MTRNAWLVLLAALGTGDACRLRSDDSCQGVPCSGHGKCVVVRREPTCACQEGFRPDGLNCLPLELPPLPGAAGIAPPPPAAPPLAPSAPPAPLLAPPGVTPAPAAPGPAPPAPAPPGPALPEAQLTRLCGLALDALTHPEPGVTPDLATAAKHDVIAHRTPELVENCRAVVQVLQPDIAAVECGIAALTAAKDQDLTLGALGARDAAAAACGRTWQTLIEAHAADFRGQLQQQRETFGVAVLGFHRQYGFAGGSGEEFCRRFVAAMPEAPPELLRAGSAPPADWTARVQSCGDKIDGYTLRPLLRWCIVDRAGEILAARGAAPCERYAGPEDLAALRGLVDALVALAPAAPAGGPPAPPAPPAPRPAAPAAAAPSATQSATHP